MSNKLISVPKGTRDLFGQEAKAFTELEEIARRVFSQYYFDEVRTPIFESVDPFFKVARRNIRRC